MSPTQSVLFWLTTTALALAFFLGLLALIFKRKAVFRMGQNSSLVALLLLSALGILRWVASGHPPFVTLFESMLTSIWFALLIYQLLRLRTEHAMILLPVSLVTFLMMGWASSLPTETSSLSAALENTWLFIHASFATCGAASFLIAASFGAVYLMGEQRLASFGSLGDRLPDMQSLPRLTLNFMIFGLILWGVMIVSGAIWAHIAWGRYWAWDPIELWSLISWLLYGLVIHTRLTFKLSGRLFSWLAIAAVCTVVFALWGVGYVYETIHAYG